MNSSSQKTHSTTCPECQASIPAIPGYVNWCDRCNWNVQTPEEKESRTWTDRLNQHFGPLYERRLFESLVQNRDLLHKRNGGARILAYLIAGLVHSLTLIFAALGLFFIVKFWPNIVFLFLGLLSLAIAWVTFPRTMKRPNNRLDRQEYKTLYEITDRIAKELGLKRIDGIIPSHQFNASFFKVGWRGENYFEVGLPLFSILTPGEQVALLGHEVAHGVNKDAQRSFFIGSALQSLFRWYQMLMPESLFSSESGIEGILMVPVNLVLLILAKLVESIAYLLGLLLYQDSQRAEYLADLLSTRAAGSEHMVSMLEKPYFSEVSQLAAQRVSIDKGKNVIEELRQLVSDMPPREIERLRRVARLEGGRIDTTHPPTPLRIEFINYGYSSPAITITPDEAERLEQELETLLPTVQSQLVDEYREGLYNL